MAVFDRVAIDHWLRDEVVQKFPKGGLGDIKLGSPCIVNPYETAVFVRSGKALGTFAPGTHILTTANIPWIVDLLEAGLFGSKNVFTADVYFLKSTDLNMKWGSTSPIIIEHPNRGPGATAMTGHGTYVMKVNDPWRFLMAMDGFRDSVRMAQLKERLDPEINTLLPAKLSQLAQAKNLGPAQLQTFTKDLNTMLVGALQPEFDALGLTLLDLNIRFALHPNSLELVTRMGYGTSYSQVASLDAAQAAAANPSGSSLAETGMGLAGLQVAQNQMYMQQQQMQQRQQMQPVAQPAAVPASSSGDGEMPSVMTPAQAAAIVQVDEADIMEAIQAGDLKARKIGSKYRISKDNLNAFLSG